MKEYKVLLDDKLIGTTKFEFADVPMGVVYGKLEFVDIENPYLFFIDYCKKNEIEYSFIESEKYLNTFIIKNLKVLYDTNLVLTCNCSINGFENDYQIDAYNIEESVMKTLFISHYYDYFGKTD